MTLFPDARALENSGYLFRIVDNGGETYDRITVLFCDGDALLCTSGSICAHVESLDPQVLENEVEAGTARDLRWIDLAEGLRTRIIADLNRGFENFIEAEPAAANREEARDWQGLWNVYNDDRLPIYRTDEGGFRIRDDENEPHNAEATGEGLFHTFAEAVRWILPQAYDLSGPEYHTTVDLWDTTGGPAPEWDRYSLPPGFDLEKDSDGDWVLIPPPDVTIFSAPGEGWIVTRDYMTERDWGNRFDVLDACNEYLRTRG